MQGPTVKLTLRLPAALHEKLLRRARAANRSLNTVIVESIQQSAADESMYPEESEHEKIRRVLRETGLLEPLGPEWKKYTENAPDITHAELRQMLEGVPPLSEAIIEERDSQR